MKQRLNWKQIVIILLLPALFTTLFAFKAKTSPPNIWVGIFLPDQGKLIKDFLYWGRNGFIATDQGVYKTDSDLNQNRNDWQKLPINSAYNPMDLEFQKTGIIPTRLAVLYNHGGIGVASLSGTMNIVMKKPAGLPAGLYEKLYIIDKDRYMILNHLGKAFEVNYATNQYKAIEMDGHAGRDLKVYSVGATKGYGGKVRMLFGGEGTDDNPTLNHQNFRPKGCFSSDNALTQSDLSKVSLAGLNNSIPDTHIGQVENIISDKLNTEVIIVGDKGYVYKSTNAGGTWKYFSHGLKPQDNEMYVRSMVEGRSDMLYLSNDWGQIYYTNKNGNQYGQADWKSFGGLPGWRPSSSENKFVRKRNTMKLLRTPSYLIATGKKGNFRKPLK